MRFFALLTTAFMALLLAVAAAGLVGTDDHDANHAAASEDQQSFTIPRAVAIKIQEAFPEHAIQIIDGAVHLDEDHIAGRDVYVSVPADLCSCVTTTVPATFPAPYTGMPGTSTPALTLATTFSVPVGTPGIPGASGSVTSHPSVVEGPSTTVGTTTSTSGVLTKSTSMNGTHASTQIASSTTSAVPTESSTSGGGGKCTCVKIITVDAVAGILAFYLLVL